MRNYILFCLFLISQTALNQVVLNADGKTNTYDLINSVLASANRNVIEVPDCNHSSFGKHITQIFDAELNKYVFQFHIHVTPDNDRCQKFDRQRNEIKTYSGSPENVIARYNETVEYKWKFRISDDFKTSSSFTHIHQIKSVGGPYASIPMISLTLRKSSPDRLELRYTSTTNQSTLKTANLNLFRGTWVEVKEVIEYGNNGSYQIEIKKNATKEVLFSYKSNSIDTWQDGAEFARPKWGIYRSLNNQQDLKDEIVKYSDFSIEEITGSLSVDYLKAKAANILLFPNPASKEVEFKNANSGNYNSIELYDFSGRKVNIKKRIQKNKLDISGFSKGLYFMVFKKDTVTTKILKCYIK
ncbi:T9SS type A sorting domain-containing protein [Polaribacter aquimarinus]|uniref:Fibronectin type III n=1 Tax=Polaribacter aquimarinus TaxID=2100726 RepID=A0A2U2J8S3_9FLAO|nr:T9SS type A sorting domain-containing protein [Polaribacter aquimarinus]PWG04739.1 fibronectin type III [Polaribacter aquimarinus]